MNAYPQKMMLKSFDSSLMMEGGGGGQYMPVIAAQKSDSDRVQDGCGWLKGLSHNRLVGHTCCKSRSQYLI